MSEIKIPKKLIEVALPLDEINAACAHEKMPGIGPHPRGIHLWWARRPLAAARAVIFAQMVNDPSETVSGDKRLRETKLKIQREREELFDIIRELVKWENTNNEFVLNRARNAIRESWRYTCELNKKHPKAQELFNPEQLPAFHDPFAGGGAIPLEAQRLGLKSYASDLNPVAVMINKAMIEIPPRFLGMEPVCSFREGESQLPVLNDWQGISGFAEDVKRYGHHILRQAKERIGDLYPRIEITKEIATGRQDLEPYLGKKLKVITWLWARTVRSPNPAFSHVEVPLVSSFVLSSKKGKEAYIAPVIYNDTYTFEVKIGKPGPDAKNGTKAGRGGNFKCLMSGAPIPVQSIREQGQAGTFKQKLMAIVADGKNGRVYLPPTKEMEEIALSAVPEWKPSTLINKNPRDIRTQLYGLNEYGDLFTPRQLLALGTFSDLITGIKDVVKEHAISKGMKDDDVGLDAGGKGARAYAEAISVYLAFVLDRCTDFNNSLTGWRQGNEKIMYLFSRQAIPMVWDYGEANILESVVGGFVTNLEYQVKCLIKTAGSKNTGNASQQDAATSDLYIDKVISTDPPYYDNIVSTSPLMTQF